MNTDTETPPPAAKRTGGRRRAITVAAAALAAAAIAFGGVAFTNAYFTSQVTVFGGGIATGTVVIVPDSTSPSAPIVATGYLPGDSTSTNIVVKNVGTADAYYSIQLAAVTGYSTALAATLEVSVQVGAGTVETHTLAEWQTGRYTGLSLAAATDANLGVVVTLPGSADNTVQGTAAAFTVVIDATQQRNLPVPTPGWIAD